MNRCPRVFRTTLLALAGFWCTCAAPLLAQPVSVREFPRTAVRGLLQITAPPQIMLDGQADRLSPGARIRSPHNILLMSAALVGEPMQVNFTRDSSGLIHEVWVLSPAEAAQEREQSRTTRNFRFAAEADAPPRDDGKTPFSQLPKFPQQ